VPDRARLLAAVLDDLAAEGAALDAVVAQLEDTAWLAPTPAEGWTVAMQIAHLAWTDDQALLAVTDPATFTAAVSRRDGELAGAVDAAAASGATVGPARLVGRWRAGRAELAQVRRALRALEAADPPIDELHRAVEAQEARVREVLGTELVLRSDPSEEADVLDAQLSQDADQG